MVAITFNLGQHKIEEGSDLTININNYHINVIDYNDLEFGNFNIEKTRIGESKIALSYAIYRVFLLSYSNQVLTADNGLGLTNCEIDLLVYDNS